MHVDQAVMASIQELLGCRCEGSLKTTSGSPRAEKLRIHDFAPMIAWIDKYLSGWIPLLLSSGDRVVLLNAVLDAIPVYAMGAMELPSSLIIAIDAIRRAFLWNCEDRASGTKCLVAWRVVCRPKHEGGLGVRCLVVQNACLQVKLLHRLHAPTPSPWASYA